MTMMIKGDIDSVCHDLMELFNIMDSKLGVQIEDENIPCKPGCWACCCLLNMISLGESLLIAKYVLCWPDWRDWFDRLYRASQFCLPQVNRKEYFSQRIRCLFLDDNNRCRIYEVRPSSCRFHFAIGNKDQCYKDGDVLAINSLDLQDIIVEWNVNVLGENSVFASLPLMVLYAMGLLKGQEYVEHYDLMDPYEWLNESMETFLQEGPGIKEYLSVDEARALDLGYNV